MYLHRYYIFLLLLLFCATNLIEAQEQNISFSRIGLAQGLSQSTVTSMAQDNKGFLWFGTEDGLNKYDGYRFTVFRHKIADTLSLAHNYISAMLYSKRTNTLWVGTQNGVLHSFNETYETFTRCNETSGDQQTRGNKTILSITEDSAGRIWVGTFSKLRIYDPASKSFTPVSNTGHSDSTVRDGIISELFTDRSGNIWVGTKGGLYFYDSRLQKFQWIPFPDGGTHADSFLEDRSGAIWVGCNMGPMKIDLPNKRFIPLPFPLKTMFDQLTNRSTIISLTEDSSGALWAGTYAGLLRLSSDRTTLQQFKHNPDDPASISENSCNTIQVDKTGVLFIGTFAGINTFAPWQIKFRTIAARTDDKQSLSWNNVRSFAEDMYGNLWVGTLLGLNRLDAKTGKFTQYHMDIQSPNAVKSKTIWSLYSDGNVLYCGANGSGINIVEPDGNSPVLKKVTVVQEWTTPYSLLRDSSRILWSASSWYGLIGYNRNNVVIARYYHDPADSTTISNSTALSLSEDHDLMMWVGTDNGLNKVDLRTGKSKRYLHHSDSLNSPSGNNIICIYREPSGILWFGTYSGLNRFDPVQETFERITTENGLPNDVIYAILPDKRGNLWCSTNKGIVRYTHSTKTIKTYTTAEGLQSNEFNQRAAFVSSSGEMYFGGVNGYNVFHPEKIVDNQNIPVVVLTDFKVFNTSIHPSRNERRLTTNISDAKELFLKYSDAVLTFEFAALEYTSPEQNQYAYKMEGFNDEWIYAGTKREATYTNLDPGEYLFRVKASNNDGVWNEEGTAVTIYITPPWWMTWWFRSSLFVLVVGTITFSVQRRFAKLEKEKAMQQEFSKRLIESQENERYHIAQELHDGLGQDMLVVKSRAMLGLKTAKEDSNEREQFNEISETIAFAIQSVRGIVRDLRPYQLDSLSLSDAIRSTLAKVSESSGIVFTVTIDDLSGLFSKDVELNLFRIVQEISNNIVKHSHAAEATFEVRRFEKEIWLMIEDNGKGFDHAALSLSEKKGFGLSGIAERVRMLGGIFHIDSQKGNGTTVTVKIPMKG